MIKLTIGRKIFCGFLILIILSAAFLLISFPSLSEINILSSRVIPISEEMDSLQRYTKKVKQLENKIELYFTIRSEESQEEVVNVVKDLNKLVSQTKELQANNGVNEVAGVALKLTSATYTLLGFMDNKASSYDINVQIIRVNKLLAVFDKLQESLQGQGLEIFKKNVSRQKQIIDNLLDMFLIVEISIVFFGLLASFFLSKLITRSLSRLKKATGDIASGNFESRIDITSKDDIGELAKSFNSMADDLKTKTVSKEYVDSIISNMAEMLIVVNSDLKIRQVNDAVYGLLGYEEGELLGEPLEKIFATDTAQHNKADLCERIKGGDVFNYEASCQAKYGDAFPVLFSASVMRDESGEIIYVVCTAWDITERKLAEKKIAEISEMKSQLTSMVSHELRTPMAAIKSGINIVLDGLAGEVNDEQKEILNLSRRNVDRLARLINDVLDFQKISAGRMTFNIEENDINKIVKENCEPMKALVEGKGLKFKMDLAKDLPKVRCDRDKISQVINNLVNNAIKFTDKGSICVRTQADEAGAGVMVSDTGAGIGPENIPKVFHSFEQFHRASNTSDGGTGLGLAICKEIIEKHNGRIQVESTLGKGSEFYFVLPCD
jgi:PAS domain S-box-containing protein